MEFNTIRVATQNFVANRKLGKCGFGEGMLENGQEMAVKRPPRDSGQGLADFKTEVLIAAKLQCRNLVKLLGFCAFGKEKILVYVYLPNSSLDKFIFVDIWLRTTHINRSLLCQVGCSYMCRDFGQKVNP